MSLSITKTADVQQAASSTGYNEYSYTYSYNDDHAEVSNSSLKPSDPYYKEDDIMSDLDKQLPVCVIKKKNFKKSQDEPQNAVPDSTTSSLEKHIFNSGDDVLVPNRDGRYYLGTIVEINTRVETGHASCLIKFGDGTHSWASASTLKLLSAPSADDNRLMCVVCKRREGTVVACDLCGRGYHGCCHTPAVTSWITDASWHCRRCVEHRYRAAAAENRALRRAEFLRSKMAPRDASSSTHASTSTCTVLSDGFSDHSDSSPEKSISPSSWARSEFQKVQSNTNCYCGAKNDYLAQMILCCRCTKWFHQRCVQSLRYPLFNGDKFYVFACSACNAGVEFLRRLELRWLDLAHLALYNLTSRSHKKYFDLDQAVMPYVMDNWTKLQLPDKMSALSPAERRERMLGALSNCGARFKCGREMKKRATIWGLRVRRPPPPPPHLAPVMNASGSGLMCDELLSRLAPRLRVVARPPTPPRATTAPHANDRWGEMVLPPTPPTSVSAPPTPPAPPPSAASTTLSRATHADIDNVEDPPDPLPPTEFPQYDSDLDLADFRKTSDKSDNLEEKCSSLEDIDNLEKDEDFLVRVQNDIEDASDSNSKNSILSLYEGHTSKIAEMNIEISKLSTNNIIEHSKIMSLSHRSPYDRIAFNLNEQESSSDETSSRGTLDVIIPPLKDFQGKNNPFLMQNRLPHKTGKSGRPRLSLPVNLNAPGVSAGSGPGRPLKRQLSQTDLLRAPNGEVKRRKLRKGRKNSSLNQSLPVNGDSNGEEWKLPKSMEKDREGSEGLAQRALLQGRRLRIREQRNYCTQSRRNTTNHNNITAATIPTADPVKTLQLSPQKNSPIKQDNQCISELKSSMHSYFGAVNRIGAGQSFNVVAKRISENGKMQFLIDWESHGS